MVGRTRRIAPSEVVEIDVGDAGWPLLVIGPGLALLLIGFLIGGPPGVWLSIAGSITTMVGVVLFHLASICSGHASRIPG